MNKDTTKRSINQVIFRHTLESLMAIDEVGLIGQIVDIAGEIDNELDKNMLFLHLTKTINAWDELSNGRTKGYENISIDSIEAIRPNKVIYWKVFPNVYECINESCKTIHIGWNKGFFTGRCKRCGGGLRQFRYVWYHHCGHIRALYPLPDRYCPTHKDFALYLDDTGKFSTSYWKCRECNHQAKLGMPNCPDINCKNNFVEGDKKHLDAAVWSDPWVYFSHIITFVNINGEQLKNSILIGKNKELILKGYLGEIGAGKNQLLGKNNFQCTNCHRYLPEAYPFCPFCQSPLKYDKSYKRDLLDILPDTMFNNESDLTIFSALRDLERSESLKDNAKYSKLLNKVGIDDIIYIGDFPMTNAAIGFSRSKSKPPAWLNAFNNKLNSSQKLPVYTNSITTEALLIQISAIKILKWLDTNNIAHIVVKDNTNEEEAKMELLKYMAQDNLSLDKIKVINIIRDLIHSCSHALLYTLSLNSGLEVTSFGEMDLLNALSFILYANESELGGLKSIFNQGIPSIIDSLTENLRTCKFDPSCSEDDDGVCIGCLYLPRGCNRFNSGLSRNYLFGGRIESIDTNIKIGFLDLSS